MRLRLVWETRDVENGGYVQIYINDSKCWWQGAGDEVLWRPHFDNPRLAKGKQHQVDLEYQVGKGTLFRAFWRNGCGLVKVTLGLPYLGVHFKQQKNDQGLNAQTAKQETLIQQIFRMASGNLT
jgi:hypothetical protein